MDQNPPSKLGIGQQFLEGAGCVVKLGYWLMMAILLSDVLAILLPNGCAAFRASQEKARLMQACSNARQIIICLNNYAADHGGRYPDGEQGLKTSNDAFRVLFKAGLVEDERAFTAHMSPFVPDNQCDDGPSYSTALDAGENHWSMVTGLNANIHSEQPLIFENSVNLDTWPPKWNCDEAGQKVPGRAWKSSVIVIGRVDGSVQGERLETVRGESVSLQDEEKLFPQTHDGLRILDVAR